MGPQAGHCWRRDAPYDVPPVPGFIWPVSEVAQKIKYHMKLVLSELSVLVGAINMDMFINKTEKSKPLQAVADHKWRLVSNLISKRGDTVLVLRSINLAGQATFQIQESMIEVSKGFF